MNIRTFRAFAAELEKVGEITPSPQQIKEALRVFCKQHGLDPAKAVVGAGSAMYLRGLRPSMNDIDGFHPDLTRNVKGYVGGIEVDMGGLVGQHAAFPPSAFKSSKVRGLSVQTLSALLVFYKVLNRPKDQKWIKVLSKKTGARP